MRAFLDGLTTTTLGTILGLLLSVTLNAQAPPTPPPVIDGIHVRTETGYYKRTGDWRVTLRADATQTPIPKGRTAWFRVCADCPIIAGTVTGFNDDEWAVAPRARYSLQVPKAEATRALAASIMESPFSSWRIISVAPPTFPTSEPIRIGLNPSNQPRPFMARLVRTEIVDGATHEWFHDPGAGQCWRSIAGADPARVDVAECLR